MPKKIVIILLLLTASIQAKPDQEFPKPYYIQNASKPLVWVELTFNIFSSSFLTIAPHEAAHYFTAKWFGGRDVQIHISAFSGYVTYHPDSAVNELEQTIISLAGYSTNRLLAWGTDELLDATNASGWPARWLGMYYLLNFFAPHAGLINAAIYQSSDFWNVAELATKDTFTRALVLVGFAGIVTLDTILSWNTIKRNIDRAQGKVLEGEATAHRFMITPTYVAYQYTF